MTVQSRRAFLQLGAKASVAGAALVALNACGQKSSSGAKSAAACVDLESMSSSDQALRRSMNYVDASQKAGETCSVCAFFTAGAGGCGTCKIFTGGPANPGGHCDSWAAKPA